MSSKGIFPTYKWHFFCSISPCALMVSLVNSFSMTGTPMLNVPFSMLSWMLFFSIVLERITGMEISTPFCFLIAVLTLNPNYKMNMFCYKKQREMMKLSKMVTLVFSQHSMWNTVWKYTWNIIIISHEDDYLFLWKRMWKYELCEIPCERKRCEKEQCEIPCEKECETKVTRPEMHGL